MAYASYRCLIDAPMQQIWDILKMAARDSGGSPIGSWRQILTDTSKLSRSIVPLTETMDIDEAAQTIKLKASSDQGGQALRQFRLVLDPTVDQVALECILDWKLSDALMQDAIQPHLEQFVREPILAIKSMVEQQSSVQNG